MTLPGAYAWPRGAPRSSTRGRHRRVLLYSIALCAAVLATLHLIHSAPARMPLLDNIQEIQVLQNPTVADVFDAFYQPSIIAEDGAMESNRHGYLAVGYQRDAVFVILRGIATSDSAAIDKGIAAIEYGFRFQNPEGYFVNNLGLTPLGAISSDAFFLRAVGHAALAVQSYAPAFADRFENLRASIELALQWLSRDQNQAELQRQDANLPNHLLVDAGAYMLNGTFLKDTNLHHIGIDFLKLALQSQRSDGAFRERGGPDSGYQGVDILLVQLIKLWSQHAAINRRMSDSLNLGVAWEKPRIEPDTGRVLVDGNSRTGRCQERGLDQTTCKNVDYRKVTLGMAYWSVVGSDPESETLARALLGCATSPDCPIARGVPAVSAPSSVSSSEAITFTWSPGFAFYRVFSDLNSGMLDTSTAKTSITLSPAGNYYATGTHYWDVAGCNRYACNGPARASFGVVE